MRSAPVAQGVHPVYAHVIVRHVTHDQPRVLASLARLAEVCTVLA